MRTITRDPGSDEQTRRTALPRRFALEAAGLAKVVAAGDAEKVVLNDVDINIRKSQFTVIKGESGSGKTSLLHCLAGLDQPTRGKIVSGDVDITQLTRGQQVDWRGNNMGYVGQKADLLAGPVISSILDPHLIAGHQVEPEWALKVFTTLGIDSTEFLRGSTSKLSGGEQQRVAIARALVQRPDILFADEPTSALDSERTAEVHGLLRSMVDEHGVTVVMVSHDPLSEMYAHTVEVMQDGNLTTNNS